MVLPLKNYMSGVSDKAAISSWDVPLSCRCRFRMPTPSPSWIERKPQRRCTWDRWSSRISGNWEEEVEVRYSTPCVASQGPRLALTYFIAGEREVNCGGRTKWRIEKTNVRMKVFIGFQRVADMSNFGMSWSKRKVDGQEINFDLDQERPLTSFPVFWLLHWLVQCRLYTTKGIQEIT